MIKVLLQSERVPISPATDVADCLATVTMNTLYVHVQVTLHLEGFVVRNSEHLPCASSDSALATIACICKRRTRRRNTSLWKRAPCSHVAEVRLSA